MATIIIARPRFDAATTFLFEWADDVIDYIKQNRVAGDRLVDIQRSAVTRDRITTVLNSNRDNNGLYFHFDHGQYKELIGHNRDIVIDMDNAGILKGYGVYAFACESARILGREAVKAGARCYLGYKEPFGFIITKLDDFRRVAVEPAIALVAGKTFAEARDIVVDLLSSLLNKYYQEYLETGDLTAYFPTVKLKR